jgi:hypothetical protein
MVMSMDRAALSNAIKKYKIPQIIIGYLKLQQAKKNDFFALFMDKKINGRLFYNTSLADGTKETKYGNEDFLQPDFISAVDHLFVNFQSLSLEQVKTESVKPTVASEKMQEVIDAFVESVETNHEWQHFWECEIRLQSGAEQKKKLYNLIAGAAAYKALVTCVNESPHIHDPLIKRNIAVLIGICTNKYEARSLQASSEFQVRRTDLDAMGDFTVFKKQKENPEIVQAGTKKPLKKRHHKKAVELKPANALMK